MTPQLTTDDLAQLFRRKPTRSSRKVIKFGVERYGLTFEGSRDMLYRALDCGDVRLTPDWRVERGNVHP